MAMHVLWHEASGHLRCIQVAKGSTPTVTLAICLLSLSHFITRIPLGSYRKTFLNKLAMPSVLFLWDPIL